MKALNTLRVLPLFSNVTDEDADLLSRNSHIRSCKKGEFLFMHGDEITHFYIICRGVMQIFRETPDGHEITNDLFIAGDNVNVEEIISKQSIHTMNAKAVEDTSILEIPISWLKSNFNKLDHIAAILIADISQRLHNVQIEAEHQSTMSATQIVACYLQRLCILYNFDPKGFDLPYSKTLIASRLRIELETFSRTLKNLKEQGIIVSGSHVSFTDVEKATKFACESCSMSEDCTAHNYLHTRLKKSI